MPRFGWQQNAGDMIDASMGALSGLPRGANFDRLAPSVQKAANAGSWVAGKLSPQNLDRVVGGAAWASDKTVGFANSVNDWLTKQGRGTAGRFSTVGSIMSAVPLKNFAKNYAVGTVMMMGMETMMFGKSLSMGTLGEVAWSNIPLTLGFELAGASLKGGVKAMGWQVLGSAVGLGPWGSLGLQVAGSVFMPGLGLGMAAAAGGYYMGKAAYNMGKGIVQAGKRAHRTEFESGDLSFQTANASTMRQRSLSAIQNSHMNMRSLLGNEAAFLMGRG